MGDPYGHRNPGATDAPTQVELEPASPGDLADYGRRIQRAFTDGAIQGFGYDLDAPIPSDREVWESLRTPGAQPLHVLLDGDRVGGAVVTIADDGRTGSLDTFFIDGGGQNRGLGLAAWRAIEARYPSVELWTALTPYFDTRNIHFYVNKCGFRIVEFFHPGHPEPHEAERGLDGPPRDGTDRMFSFEKRMRPAAEGGNQPDAASPSSAGSLG